MGIIGMLQGHQENLTPNLLSCKRRNTEGMLERKNKNTFQNPTCAYIYPDQQQTQHAWQADEVRGLFLSTRAFWGTDLCSMMQVLFKRAMALPHRTVPKMDSRKGECTSQLQKLAYLDEYSDCFGILFKQKNTLMPKYCQSVHHT